MAERDFVVKNIEIKKSLIVTLDVAAAKKGMRVKHYLNDLVERHLLKLADADLSGDKIDEENTNSKFTDHGSY